MSDRFRAPPMPFAMSPDEGVALAETVPGVCAAHDIMLPPGRGSQKVAAWWPLEGIGPLRCVRPGITLPEFDK